jgi:hypothetical protein
MSDVEVFGPLVLATDVEDAVEATLKLWMATYLGFVDRHIGRVSPWLLPPKSYTVTSDWDAFPEEQSPAVLIMCPGVTKPLMDGKREYRAIFPVSIGVRVEAPDRRSTERLAKYYGGAIRALLSGKGSLGDFAVATTWEDEKYGTHVSDRSQRTFGSADLKFNVEVRQVVRRLSGPAEPLKAPGVAPAAWPKVTHNTPIVEKPEAI